MSLSPNDRPTPEVAARIEELLREQLAEMGVVVKNLQAHEIKENMACHIEEDYSMTYFWRDFPILYVSPEERWRDGERSVYWRMFTRDEDSALDL